MLVPVLLFAVGLVFLIKGGDWFVDGASALARRFHLPELLIGATVVSIGTTLPEVMVSTMSALSGHGEIAYGNAIGSVICNQERNLGHNTQESGSLILKINSLPADKRASFSPEEIRLMRATVNRLRNEKLAKGQYTDATDDVLLKLI